MHLIASSQPGRVRLRNAALRDPQRLERLHGSLAKWKGVLGVETNPKAGSVVVRYDATRLERRHIEARIEAVAAAELARPLPQRGRITRVQVNRYAKRGMLASLAVSLLLAAAGLKRWHAASGGVFLASLLVHLAVHRRHVLR